jgi:UTP--glucose-1-phosphate uridylyltransferase
VKIRKAVIPAAGLGTRFLPATKAQPKEMLPIIDTPTIQLIVEEAVQSGIESIIIVTSHNKKAIEDHFDVSYELESILEEKGKLDLLRQVRRISQMIDVQYVRQKEPLGLGHAILCAQHFVEDEPFAVLLGDDIMVAQKPALRQMMEVYEQTETPVIGVQEVPWSEVDKYGIVAPSPESIQLPRTQYIQDLVEKPERDLAPSNKAIVGRYILTSDIFPLLKEVPVGKGGEIQLTDALRILNRTKPMVAYELDAKRYDVGDKFGYLQASIEFALKREDLADKMKSYLQSVVSRSN